MLLSFACRKCADRPWGELARQVQAAIRRDVFGGGEVELLPASALAPGEHA